MELNYRTIIVCAVTVVAFCVLFRPFRKREYFTEMPAEVGVQGSSVEPAEDNENSQSRDINDFKGVMEIDIINDGTSGDSGLLYSPCSLSCCHPTYPVNIDVSTPGVNPNDYVSNPYSCTSTWGTGAGCVCMTKKQRDMLGTRAGNA